MTEHAIRQRLKGLVELLRGESVCARPVIAKLFPEPIMMRLVQAKPRPVFEASGRIVLAVEGERGAVPAMVRELKVTL